MNKQLTASIGFAALLIQMAGCSKTVVNVDPQNPQQTQSASSPNFVQPALVNPSRTERVAEIDRLLAAPLTGTAEDSDRRVALRAERDALTGGFGNHSVTTNQSADMLQKARVDAQAERDHQRMIREMKADAERSKISEQRQLQAQRDQWDKEDRMRLRYQNGNFHPEAPPANVYDIQVQRQRNNNPNP
jgi:hypothetical protein